MKIIFLDIDGVLNCNGEGGALLPSKVDLLNKLVENTQANIVVHSSWRTGRTVGRLREILLAAGVKASILGKTRDSSWKERSDSECRNRPQQIADWLQDARDLFGFEIDSFVILDDFHMDGLEPLSIQTDPRVGLTESNIQQAEKILNYAGIIVT